MLLACWFLAENTDRDPDLVIPPDDHVLADLLVSVACGEHVGDEIRTLLTDRTRLASRYVREALTRDLADRESGKR